MLGLQTKFFSYKSAIVQKHKKARNDFDQGMD